MLNTEIEAQLIYFRKEETTQTTADWTHPSQSPTLRAIVNIVHHQTQTKMRQVFDLTRQKKKNSARSQSEFDFDYANVMFVYCFMSLFKLKSNVFYLWNSMINESNLQFLLALIE